METRRRPNNTLPRARFLLHNGFRFRNKRTANTDDEKTIAMPVRFRCDSGPRPDKKGSAPSGAASTAAKICENSYAVREDADGWPEAPVVILFHHEKSKVPWAHNPAIRVL
jgi:hypothetical protein